MKFRKFHVDTHVTHAPKSRDTCESVARPLKEYSRFPQTQLPAPLPLINSLDELMERRESNRDHDPSAAITLGELTTLLHAAGGLQKDRKRPEGIPLGRHHPSGGALYPIEYYVSTPRVDGLPSKLFHYNPHSNSLEELLFAGTTEDVARTYKGLVPDQDPAAVIILSAVWGRSYAKYGDFAYRIALIEAGHSMQDALLAGTAMGLSLCPISGIRHEETVEALKLTGDEDPLYAVLVGKPKKQ